MRVPPHDKGCEAINFLASLAILTALFAMLFKWFPDTLKGSSRPTALRSIVILLIWVHYSAQIVLFGAELTHAYATETGARRTTDVNAELPHKATA